MNRNALSACVVYMIVCMNFDDFNSSSSLHSKYLGF